jgi:hypothetical protein
MEATMWIMREGRDNQIKFMGDLESYYSLALEKNSS